MRSSGALGLALALSIVVPAAGQSVQGEPLRDRPAASDPQAPYQADEPGLPALRIPLPLLLFEWPLPPEAYAKAAEPTPEPTPSPSPAATPTPAPSPTPAASPQPTASPVASPTPDPDPQPGLGAPISGILYLSDGATPAANRLAVLVNKDTGRIVTTTTTGPDGAFTFPARPEGNYKVLVGRVVEPRD